MAYPQKECPVCHKPLLDGEDIVICPDCGTPYHRDCYRQAGHCLFEDKHGTGYEYQAPAAKPQSQAAAPPPPPGQQAAPQHNTQWQRSAPPPGGWHTQGIQCPQCGTMNTSQSIFCSNCGIPLHAQRQQPSNWGGPLHAQRQQTSNWGGPNMAGAPPYVDYSGEIDGISKADWAAYIGNSAPVYIMRMSQQDKQNTKISFMFSAFFLTPFFFLYRKMWGWAAATIAFGVLGFGLSFLSFMVAASNPAVAFIDPGFLGGLITIYNLLNFVISILAGIFGLYLYRRGAAKKIKALRAIHSDDTAYHAALSKKGGTSIVAVVISIAIIFVFSTIFTYTIGVDIVADFLQESGFYDGF